MSGHDMHRGDMISRALAFVALAHSGQPLTVANVQQALSCSPRTAHRWLAQWRARQRLRVAA